MTKPKNFFAIKLDYEQEVHNIPVTKLMYTLGFAVRFFSESGSTNYIFNISLFKNRKDKIKICKNCKNQTPKQRKLLGLERFPPLPSKKAAIDNYEKVIKRTKK